MIINLTQHRATPEQVAAGVVDVPADRQALLKALLTVEIAGKFADLSETERLHELLHRADEIVSNFVAPEQVARAEAVCRQAEQRGHPASGVDALAVVMDARAVECMVGGFPPLVRALRQQLAFIGAVPVEALSDRVVTETINENGTVDKQAIFKHLGFTYL